MTQCTPKTRVHFQSQRPLDLQFDAPAISSDGGGVLLRQIDDRLGLSRWFSACLPDARQPGRVRHTRQEQVRQRLYQIGLGYEDCNDADHLRHDRLLRTVCGREPDDEVGLSSQPTLSRLENAADGRSLRRLCDAFEDSYVAGLAADTEVVVLDIDATCDPTHGGQQLSFFHGFYDTHMYHPLLLFDDQGQLVSVLLRPGNSHASRGAVGMLERVIRKLKRRLPELQIVVRGDSGFAMPRLMTKLEALSTELGDVDYVFGLARNPVLERLAADPLAEAERRHRQTKRTVQYITEDRYAAKTWPYERRLVIKSEWMGRGANPRFVVTSLQGFAPELIYRAYCHRGQCENYIKDLKNALFADRLSCSTYLANAFRLLLHAAAYRLMFALRIAVREISPERGRWQFDTLRLRLLKVAAWVTRSARRVVVRLPRAFPLAELFRALAAGLDPPPQAA